LLPFVTFFDRLSAVRLVLQKTSCRERTPIPQKSPSLTIFASGLFG